MINKETYKRLTETKKINEYCSTVECGEHCEDCYVGNLYERLAELEDKILNGTLTELTCKGIEELDIIKKGMIFILYQMCLEQNLGPGVFLKYISEINEWFKNYFKNKELQEKQECR